MKIRIELDVAPNEVPLATELIAVLRSLTDHVNVATSNSLSKPSGSASDALTSSMQLSAGHVSVPHPPCPAIVTPPRQAPPLQAAPSQPQKPSKRDMQHIFTEILRRAEFAENPKQIVQELEAIAWAPTASLPLADRRNETTFRAFVSSWEELALDPTLPKQNRSAVSVL